MSTVNCRNCNAPNPAGSKFCNNCGTALPPTTKLICPSCQTANPRSLLYCDNCGTRLVQQEGPPARPKQRPAEQESAGEETQSPGHRAFSLPARQSGSTVDLDIHSLPDWLRSDWGGEEAAPAAPETTPPASEEEILGSWLSELQEVEGEPAEPNAGQPSWLQETEAATAALSGGDSLPDWLTTAETDQPAATTAQDDLPDWLQPDLPAEQPAPPTGADTAGDYPDWLAEMGLEEPAAPSDPSAGDDLPDWLAEASAGQPAEAADETFPDWLAAVGNVETTAEAAPTADDFPDWFSQAAEEPAAAIAGAPTEDEPLDWLAEISGEQAADAPTDQPIADFATWLQPDAEIESAGDDDDIFGDDLPDWLKDSPLSPTDSQLKGGTDELSQWLVDAIETTPPTPEPAQPAVSDITPTDDMPDWLRDVQSVGTAAEAAIFGEQTADEAPIFGEETILDGPTTEPEAPDWLNAQMGLDEETAASIFTLADEEDSGGLPDWFSAAEPAAPAQAAAPAPEPELPSPSDDLPDWIKEMAPRNTGLLNTGGLTAAEEEAAEEHIDWLAEISSEGEVSGDSGPLPEIGLPDALPDWLADLAPPDTGSLGRPRTGGLDRPRTGPLPPITPQTAGQSELEEPDWLADLLPPDTGDEEEPPAAPTRRRLPDVPITELPSARERRTGPLTPPPSQELEGVPMELASADLPEWLTSELGPPPGPGGPSIPVLRDVPDWLDAPDESDELAGAVLGPPPEGLTGAEWQDILSGLPPGSGAVAGGAVATADADIPAWLQALRPRAFGEGGQVPVADDAPALTTGPLAGLRGAIEIEATAAQPHEAKRLPPAIISKEQQRQVALLHQLMHDEQRQAIPVDRRPAAAATGLTRFGLALALLLAVIAGLIWPDLLPTTPPPLPAAAQTFYDTVSKVSDQTVLVVFDYSPAMAGELNSQAEMVLGQLLENGNTLYYVSQYVTGDGVARQLAIEPPLDTTKFIAGEAIGLRRLSSCLQGIATCPTGSEETPLPNNVALIVLLTGERDSLTGWVEQVATSTDAPMVAAVTQAVAPIALTYAATEQLDGVISGLPAAAAYESQYRPGETDLAEQAAGQTFALWLVIVLLIIGNVFGWLTSLRPGAARGGGS